MSVSRGIHHIAMRVHKFDEVVQFYTEGLGFSKSLWWGADDKRAVLLDTGDGSFLELFAGGQETGTPGSYIHLALRTDNCDQSLQAAVAAGAVVTKEPVDVDIASMPQMKPVRIAFCKGLAQEVIEFFQER